MKTRFSILLIVILSIFISKNIYAQLKVSSYGNFAVATVPIPAPYAKFGISFSPTSFTPGGFAYGLVSNVTTAQTYNKFIGIYGQSYRTAMPSGGRSYGVYGIAGNGESGYTYGVYGKIIGDIYGAGVFGVQRSLDDYGVFGDYAGFFYGNTKVVGTIWADAFVPNSDRRLKKNIVPIKNTFNKIFELNAVEFNYKTIKELKAEGLIASTDTANTDEPERKFIDKTHYGYIAQEIQQILPDLVYQGDDGFLGLDYIGLIPLMLEAIKQQNITINNLQQQMDLYCDKSKNSNQNNVSNDERNKTLISAVLYQNTPNPFSQNTDIKCYIPEKSKTSSLFIYDMQGTQIKKIQINEIENVKITIHGFDLKAGMYMYTLIIDGKEVDTKKMILTQ